MMYVIRTHIRCINLKEKMITVHAEAEDDDHEIWIFYGQYKYCIIYYELQMH